MTTFAQLFNIKRPHPTIISTSKEGVGKARGIRKRHEHDLQCACVQWFRLQYPALTNRLFAVPNGGARSKATAGKLKAEGVLAGVADLILLKPNDSFGALLIEMKTQSKSSRQSPAQRQWQKDLTALGEYKYTICRNISEFISEVNDYLKGTI